MINNHLLWKMDINLVEYYNLVELDRINLLKTLNNDKYILWIFVFNRYNLSNHICCNVDWGYTPNLYSEGFNVISWIGRDTPTHQSNLQLINIYMNYKKKIFAIINHSTISFLGCLIDMTSILCFIFYFIKIMKIKITRNERLIAILFYIIGFFHPLGTAYVLVYFLQKVIR